MVNLLREKLLNALESSGENLITETVRAIQSTLGCDMCSLWSINHNNTDSEVEEFVSASLLVRCLNEGSTYPSNRRIDYAHPLTNSFIEYVLDIISKNHKTYYLCYLSDDSCKRHLSYDSLKKMNLVCLICIPIIDVGKKDAHAFFELAYKVNPSAIINVCVEEIASVINKAIVSALSRYQIYQKQQILNELIYSIRHVNYSGNKTELKDIFYPVIHRIFRRFFDYEGASVFIWDSFDNRYNLLVTTGLEYFKEECFYNIGEGLTGEAASEKKAKIYDDLMMLEKINDPRYLHKYREKTSHYGMTLLAVPILSPSNPDNVLGIIRFTNKLNKCSEIRGNNVLDYFNDADVELIKNASHYLALNIENYLAEEERKDFISKMSHEFKTPANAIRVTAERALRKFKMNDLRFMETQLEHYMQSIIDFSNLQIMQVTTNLYLTRSISSSRSKYKVGWYSIISILKESIDIIRPIARDHGARFDNIIIDDDFPNVMLRVDKDAFKMVFYNLLSNAIKYRVPEGDFHVLFSAKIDSSYITINVSDYGIGVDSKDAERIFLLGVRCKNARQMNAEGYGIGLYIVKSILYAFGGNIRLSHNQNPTTFEIKLPKNIYRL